MFLPGVTYDSGGQLAQSIASSDLNGDGILDVPVGNFNNVGILLGKGDGTFSSAATVPIPSGLDPVIAVFDVNGDGKPDLIAASDCSQNGCNGTVWVFLGQGNGTFQAGVGYDSGGATPVSIVVADVNADGKADLLVLNCNETPEGECSTGTAGLVSVLLGNGDGTFQTAVSYESGGFDASSLAIADVNQDGKQDLLITNQCAAPCLFDGEGSVAVLLGNGDGTFQPPVAFDTGAQNPFSLVSADVNGDGKFDLVIANCAPTGTVVCGTTDGVVSVLLGNGDGTFQQAVTYDLSQGAPETIAAADLNGDHKVDIVVVSAGVDVFLGNGNGTFQPFVRYDSGSNSRVLSIAIADVNKDGRPDLVVANQCGSDCSGDGNVGVLLHVGTTKTTTSLISSPNPSVFGQVTFTATVGSNSSTPTGTVTFYDGGTAIGNTPLTSGVASLANSQIFVGSNAISAVYQGSVKYSPSISSVIDQVVTQATTTTTLMSSQNPGVVNKAVGYTATVVSQYGGQAGGTVTFSDGGSIINQVVVRANKAVLKQKYTSVGTHSITAAYSGDGNNAGSASVSLTETILDPTATVLTTSGSPSHVGQSVVFTATVTSKFGSIPNGELVTFSAGSSTLCMAPLSAGTATCTTSFSRAKTYVVKAQYSGDTTFNQSLGKVSQVVEP